MKYYEIRTYARNLRKNQTEAEKKLWERIRNRKLNGIKFLRQHPILYQSINNNLKFFIADFYCDEFKLIIELDGKIHERLEEYDTNRDEILTDLGLRVLRIKNEELDDLNCVVQKIRKFFYLPPLK